MILAKTGRKAWEHTLHLWFAEEKEKDWGNSEDVLGPQYNWLGNDKITEKNLVIFCLQKKSTENHWDK